MQRQTGKTPAALEQPDFPEAIGYIWEWFIDLSAARQYSDMGVAMPITYTEIQAWAALKMTQPTAWEVDVIKAIDRAFLSENIESKKK